MKILKEIDFTDNRDNYYKLCWDDDFYGDDCGCDD